MTLFMPSSSILVALAAATFFGLSTPFAKLLVGEASAMWMAGLLYLGSGLGLSLVRLLRDRGWSASGVASGEWKWLLAAIVFGGVLGPLAMVYGLFRTPASTASLLLNLEGVLTAVLAWLVFKEHVDRRLIVGMGAICLGGLVLAWSGRLDIEGSVLGPLAIALACACWALDNNLTRKVAAADALFIAASRGLVAGSVSCLLAISSGNSMPSVNASLAIMLVGLLGYGVSLVLFVLALRGLGAARTGAYFSIAPFIGAAASLVLLGEPTNAYFWLAAALMAWGVVLHVTESHEHEHLHEALAHVHPHSHDAHHQHEHSAPWDGSEPHTHWHVHAPLRHSHAHFPDMHHQHRH